MSPKSVGNTAVSDKQQEENQESSPVGKGTISTIVKKLVKQGKDKGFLTYDEINKALPANEYASDQIEDAMATFSDMGVQLVEKEDDATEEAEGNENAGGNIADDDTGRTDDPVRMYLREMGAVELLSREGEIAIAKRIEAGREMMIGGICESPLAIESIIAWHKALEEGDILLREVIDLDATYNAGPDDEEVENAEEDESAGEVSEEDSDAKDEEKEGEDGEEAEEEAAMSLAAMEEELAPQVYEIFGNIKKTYKKMRKHKTSALKPSKRVKSQTKPSPKNTTRPKKKWSA